MDENTNGLEADLKDCFLVKQAIIRRQDGKGFHQPMKIQMPAPGSRVTFIHELGEVGYRYAVKAVDGQGCTVGYVPENTSPLVGALLDAGKLLYGIVRVNEHYENSRDRDHRGQETVNSMDEHVPEFLYVDLYMDNSLASENEQNKSATKDADSFVIADVVLDNTRMNLICEICAVRILDGEIDTFHQNADTVNALSSSVELVRRFDLFAGMLPILGFRINGEKKEKLLEENELYLNKQFPNKIIDVSEILRRKLPGVAGSALDEVNRKLGLYVSDLGGAEENCIMILALYRFLKMPDQRKRVRGTKLRMTLVEDLIKDEKLRQRAGNALIREGIIFLGDITDLSRRELSEVAGLGKKGLEDVEALLSRYGLSLSSGDDGEMPVLAVRSLKTGWNCEQANSALLKEFTDEERNRLERCTIEERSILSDAILHRNLCLKLQSGDRRGYLRMLFLGAAAGYCGDYSEAGFAAIAQDPAADISIQDGYSILVSFYNDLNNGFLSHDARKNAAKVCFSLAMGVLSGDLFDSDCDLLFRADTASKLLKEAVRYARYAALSEESGIILMQIGRSFYDGQIRLRNDVRIKIEKDLETAYKAFYYADHYCAADAPEMMEKVMQKCREQWMF